jgi:hypothetical protein
MKKHKGLPSYKNHAAYCRAWRKLTGKNKSKKPRHCESGVSSRSDLRKYYSWLTLDDCGGMTPRVMSA